jgi:dihydroxyacetone kinase
MSRPERATPVAGGYKKLINKPFQAVGEALEGFIGAHGDLVTLKADRVVVRRTPATGKVGFVVGGGSGPEPAFAGYIGVGIAEEACGDVFASPPPDVISRRSARSRQRT